MKAVMERIAGGGLLALVLALGGPVRAEPPPEAAAEARARAAVQQLQLSLQLALGYAMLEGGPGAAVEACNLQGQPVTGQISQALGLEVGRTALRTRNPGNDPDPWEQEQLARFAERLAQGEPASALEAVRQDEGGLRYMKAIAMQPQCLSCHGPEVEPALQRRILALYPQDRATGFRPGELRGAFTVTVPSAD